VPMMRLDYLPPIGDGFRAFVNSEDISKKLVEVLEEVLDQKTSSPYDSHPTLKERIAALEILPATSTGHNDHAPASTIIKDSEKLERWILSVILGRPAVDRLKSVPWDEVGRLVYLPYWKSIFTEERDLLGDLTTATVPEVLAKPEENAARIRSIRVDMLNMKMRHDYLFEIVGVALALALLQEGWQMAIVPGVPICFEKTGQRIYPFKLIRDLAEKKISAEDWLTAIARADLSNSSLGKTTEI
jgi:heat shock protein HtpX